ncbi:MAG: hypothetical protein JXB10_13985 [Pirellulales bacterium]|nr:hypothetical protein [Pirellulales bacterium]
MKSLFRKFSRFLAAESGMTAMGFACIFMLVILVGLSVVVMIGRSTSRNVNQPDNPVNVESPV